MSGVEVHRIERVFSAVAFEVADRVQQRTRERFQIGLAEYTEEWHVAATGFVVANELVSTLVEIEFSMDFFDAPEQRNGDLFMPSFTFGSYQDLVDSPTLVVATAAVREWTRRDDDAFIGAKVAVAVYLPGDAIEETDFDILFHLQFSGWGAPHDAETGEDGGLGEGGD